MPRKTPIANAPTKPPTTAPTFTPPGCCVTVSVAAGNRVPFETSEASATGEPVPVWDDLDGSAGVVGSNVDDAAVA